jgi:hypothetical protein
LGILHSDAREVIFSTDDLKERAAARDWCGDLAAKARRRSALAPPAQIAAATPLSNRTLVEFALRRRGSTWISNGSSGSLNPSFGLLRLRQFPRRVANAICAMAP